MQGPNTLLELGSAKNCNTKKHMADLQADLQVKLAVQTLMMQVIPRQRKCGAYKLSTHQLCT